jgi:dihydrodipicolinate synthase/N-acetylneuraminate lyase
VLVYNISRHPRGDPCGGAGRAGGPPQHHRRRTGDIDNFAAYRAAVPGWSALIGSASLLLPALERGADGGICGAACFAARACADLFAAWRAGDRGRAASLQERLTPLDRRIVAGLGAAGVKAAMAAPRLYGGPVRAPLADLPDAETSEVTALVRG